MIKRDRRKLVQSVLRFGMAKGAMTISQSTEMIVVNQCDEHQWHKQGAVFGLLRLAIPGSHRAFFVKLQTENRHGNGQCGRCNNAIIKITDSRGV